MKTVITLWVGRLLLGLFIFFLLLSVMTCFFKPSAPPNAQDAPWAIQTYSNDKFHIPARIYYAESIEFVDGTPIAQGAWWDYDGKNYHKHKGEKPFPPEEYGNIDIIRRVK